MTLGGRVTARPSWDPVSYSYSLSNVPKLTQQGCRHHDVPCISFRAVAQARHAKKYPPKKLTPTLAVRARGSRVVKAAGPIVFPLPPPCWLHDIYHWFAYAVSIVMMCHARAENTGQAGRGEGEGEKGRKQPSLGRSQCLF